MLFSIKSEQTLPEYLGDDSLPAWHRLNIEHYNLLKGSVA